MSKHPCALWAQQAIERNPHLPQWVRLALERAPVEDDSDSTGYSYFAGLDDLEADLNTGTDLHMRGWEDAEKILRSVDLDTWMCTDTHVGLRAVLFQGEAVALSFQPARKSDMSFLWFSKEDAERVRKALRDIADRQDEGASCEVASDDPSQAWIGVRRALLRPEVPEPVLVVMVHPQTGETVQVDVRDMRQSGLHELTGPLERLLCRLTPEQATRVSNNDLRGATPGEQFATFAKVTGPELAGQAYFGKA